MDKITNSNQKEQRLNETIKITKQALEKYNKQDTAAYNDLMKLIEVRGKTNE